MHTQEELKKIRKDRQAGLSYSQLSLKYLIPIHSIRYLIDDKFREKTKERNRENKKKNYEKIKAQRKRNNKYRIYQREYHLKKYHSDPEFRDKQIKASLDFQRRKKLK